MKLHSILGILLLLTPILVMAEWRVITHTDTDTNIETRVAYEENESGYTLEIYKDAVGAVRSRFALVSRLSQLADHNCPTFQIDERRPKNRSINEAPCIPDKHWAEFILGYIEDNEITSSPLNALMNGKQITYRFILMNGGYKETTFSLIGSKKAMITVLGDRLRINPAPDIN